MSKKYVTAVYDCKAEVYTPPMCNATKGEAIRSFSDAVNNRDSQLNLHPEDFTLYQIGLYDVHSGSFDCLTEPVYIGRASEFVRQLSIPESSQVDFTKE